MHALRRLAAIRFTLIGVISAVVLALTGRGIVPPEGVWLLLMIPTYVVHLLIVGFAVASIENPPTWLNVVTFPLLLGPFAALDYLLWKRRKRAGSAASVPSEVGH